MYGNRQSLFRLILLGVWLILIGSLAACTDAPEDVGYYTEFQTLDYVIDTNGDVHVTESLKYVYQQGAFHFGYANIPLGKSGGITNVEVWEGDQHYRQTDGDEKAYVYQTSIDELNDRLLIRWFYPYTTRGNRTFTLKYTVRQAVRIYPGGDQLWAVVVGAEHTSMVYVARATVRLPIDVAPADLVMASYGTEAEPQLVDARTIRFSTSQLAAGQQWEVRVQWPHGAIQAAPAPWQVQEERIQDWALCGTGISLVLLVLGFGVLFALWYSKGRDPRVRRVAAYLPTPPSDLPPALAGLLLAEKTHVRFIVATIVDLSRRGVLQITEWGERDYEFKLFWDQPRLDMLRPYERDVLEALFSPLEALQIGARLMRSNLQTRVSLREVRQHFASYVRPIQDEMAQTVVQERLFIDHPEATAGRYFGVGVGLLVGTVLALVLLFLASPNVLSMFSAGALAWIDALMMWGRGGFMLFASLAFSAIMTGLAILGQFVGRYTWYAAMSWWTYAAFVIGGLGIALGGWLVDSLVVVLPLAVALVIWSVGIIAFSFYMPRTTPAGAVERAKWEAFKRYLGQIELFGDLTAAQEIFDRYLPYAIAFRIEKEWVKKFATVDTPAPAWFVVPALALGTASMAQLALGTAAGTAAVVAPVGAPGLGLAAGSLADVSDGLYHSLQDVSEGLFNMLGTVSTGLSTGPLESLQVGDGSGSGGGTGGWSGGGGLGAGGFGGGGRGVG